jgi:ubiquinone/menaquinone biosynthesis C-methylase UbiE
MLRQARRRLARAGLRPRLLRASAKHLPFQSGSFSDVVATFPAPYILETVTLEEVQRVLRPDGQLVIVDAGKVHMPGSYRALLDLIYGDAQAAESARRYRPVLEDAGFAVQVRESRIGHSNVMIVVARPVPYADA